MLKTIAKKIKVFGRGIGNFSSPATKPYPAVKTEVPATYKGRPEYDIDICVGCGACASVCPTRCISVEDDLISEKRTLKLNYGICVYCKLCADACPEEKDDKKGINFTSEFDMTDYDRETFYATNEVELKTCELCWEILSTKKVVSTKKLIDKVKRVLKEKDVKMVERISDEIGRYCVECRRSISADRVTERIPEIKSKRSN
ncbi:MAG: 4Fe-4S binding protein [Methanobacterium sp.]|jgi:formate hydrogenlyase subunit 6/NADH:ubiquinone oxidoreductase subunit I